MINARWFCVTLFGCLALAVPLAADDKGKDIPPLALDLWTPGTPLAERGESPAVLAISHAGYATMGAMGIAENAGRFGRSREATAATLGFGVVTLFQLWSGWRLYDPPPRRR